MEPAHQLAWRQVGPRVGEVGRVTQRHPGARHDRDIEDDGSQCAARPTARIAMARPSRTTTFDPHGSWWHHRTRSYSASGSGACWAMGSTPGQAGRARAGSSTRPPTRPEAARVGTRAVKQACGKGPLRRRGRGGNARDEAAGIARCWRASTARVAHTGVAARVVGQAARGPRVAAGGSAAPPRGTRCTPGERMAPVQP